MPHLSKAHFETILWDELDRKRKQFDSDRGSQVFRDEYAEALQRFNDFFVHGKTPPDIDPLGNAAASGKTAS